MLIHLFMGHYPGDHRHHRRAMAARSSGRLAAGRLFTRVCHHNAIEAQLFTGGNVENPDLLATVHHDEHDVDQRVDGRVQCRAPFANEYKVAQVLVFGMAALPLSLTLSRFTNGLTRPFFGWVSDQIGREMTMALAFSLECAAILVLFAFIDRPALFVVLTGLVFFGWGEIFSLFPSTMR
jgi:hypothetical protein